MGAKLIQLHQKPFVVTVLPQGATLADFVAMSKSYPAIRNVSFFVLSGPEEVEDNPKIKFLPFYEKALAFDQKHRTAVEQPFLYIGKVAYQLTDTYFEQPLGLSNIKPLEDLIRFAQESAIYVAQQGFEAVSYLRFKPLGPMERICRITPKQAQNYPRLTEPSVIYL